MTKARKKTTKFPGGSKIVEDGEFTAYDRFGNYLGFTSDREVAARMAQSGRVGVPAIDKPGDLSLWQFWNDAVDSGCRVMLGDDGYQVVAMTDCIFMRAKDDKHGWDVDLLTDTELEGRYWDEFYQYYRLTVVENAADKLRLE